MNCRPVAARLRDARRGDSVEAKASPTGSLVSFPKIGLQN